MVGKPALSFSNVWKKKSPPVKAGFVV